MVALFLKIINNVVMESIVTRLQVSPEPSVRFKALAYLEPNKVDPNLVRAALEEIPRSVRVQALLASRGPDGRIPLHPYQKWMGAHWVLGQLADLEYPPGDDSLMPLRDQVLEWLLSSNHEKSIRSINGRIRRCASQEGNALYAMLALGIADERAEELATRLMRWQWPDGGWNCDKKPAANHSSYHESFFALRALSLYAKISGDDRAELAAMQAAEVFLKRRLFLRLQDGDIIHPSFTRLHYPNYWHYDILIGLRVLHEAGFLNDPRCENALEHLLAKRLPDGSFPAEGKHYAVTDRDISNRSPVDWGPSSPKKPNEFVTVEALRVLQAAHKI